MTTTQPLTKVPYVVFFDLKPLNEDGNWQVCMYCVHARNGASEAPRTHFRACKITKLPGGVPPDPPPPLPPHTINKYGPHLPRAPTILSAALKMTPTNTYPPQVYNDSPEWVTTLKWCSSSPNSPLHSQPSLLCVHRTCSWLRERLRLLLGKSSKFSSLHVGQSLC